MSKYLRALMLVCAGTLLPIALWAGQARPLAKDPAVEKRMVEITQELRCLVCQNESLAGSQADLAKDLRREVRELVAQGLSNQQVRDYLVERYGDYVLYRPRVTPLTYVLWGGPFVLLMIGFWLLLRVLRQQNTAASKDAALSEEDRARARALLKDDAS